MPQSEEYKGHGKEVMADMKSRYGEKKGENVYYATMNAHPAMKVLSRPKSKKKGKAK